MMKALQFGLIAAFVVGLLAVSVWLFGAWSDQRKFLACTPGAGVEVENIRCD